MLKKIKQILYEMVVNTPG